MKTKTGIKNESWKQFKKYLVLPTLMLLAAQQLSFQSLAAPGDLDLSFDPGSALNNYVYAIVPLSGDKTFIAGAFTLEHDATLNYVAWLNADGSTDTTRQAGLYDDLHSHWMLGVYSVGVQPDGKILVGGSFVATNQTRNLVRLNADGSLDSSFSESQFATADYVVDCLALQSDGKIVAEGHSSYASGLILRLNADGSRDYSFKLASLGGDPLQNAARCLIQQADGRILVGGQFRNVSGLARTNLARLNADGSVDNSFSAPAANYPIYALALVEGNKMLIGRAYDVVRLNADGSLDSSFTGYWSGYQVEALAVQSDGKILCVGSYGGSIARLNPDGSPDTSFTASVGAVSPANPELRALAIRGDGKVLVGGWFATINAVPRQSIARLNGDGSLDNSFLNGPAGVNSSVRSLVLQKDGKLLIGGSFSQVGAASRNQIARLNPDGSLDNSFLKDLSGVNPEVTCMALQSDEKILIGGDFSSVNGVSRGRIARLNIDGSLDSSFLGTQTGPSPLVNSIVVQPDGKVVIAGTFDMQNGNYVNTDIARLNADGSLDSSFIAKITRNPNRYDTQQYLLLQPGGKILVTGSFIAVNFSARTNLARLNADGSLDGSFASGSWPAEFLDVTTAALQPDGKILLAGLTSVRGVPYVARFTTEGSLDSSFTISRGGPIGEIDALALQSDGKILVGGFPVENYVAQTNLARLNSDGTWDNSFTCIGRGVYCIVRQPDGKFLLGGNFDTVNQVVRPYLARVMGENAPLEILTPPQSQTAELGATVDFTVDATGTPMLTYLWLLDSKALAGATNDDLLVSGLDAGLAGVYTVVISNVDGAVTSAPSMLQVIPKIEYRPVPAINLAGETGSLLNLDYASTLSPAPDWLPLESVSLASPSQFYFDLTQPLSPQRFYRVWQTGAPLEIPSLELHIVPAITLTGNIGDTLRLDYINQFGPTDAWMTLDTITLTNTSQLYFDVSAIGQPPRLWRIVPVP